MSVGVKARAVLRRLGYTDSDVQREYKDWHIELRAGTAFVSIWHSGTMVYLSLGNHPVYYRSGPWEVYLDRLFHRMDSTGRAPVPAESIDLQLENRDRLGASEDN